MSFVPMSSAIWARVNMSGRDSLRSHLPTACGVTFNLSAKRACDMPFDFRPSAIRCPITWNDSDIYIHMCICRRMGNSYI